MYCVYLNNKILEDIHMSHEFSYHIKVDNIESKYFFSFFFESTIIYIKENLSTKSEKISQNKYTGSATATPTHPKLKPASLTETTRQQQGDNSST
jgi:hypothetical protein